jgi:hypothetical protein
MNSGCCANALDAANDLAVCCFIDCPVENEMQVFLFHWKKCCFQHKSEIKRQYGDILDRFFREKLDSAMEKAAADVAVFAK